MAAGNLGLPTAVVGNYSLVRRLMKRESPDQHRLLSNVRVMMPDDPDSPDWEQFLWCQKTALPEIFDIDPRVDGPRINLLSGGQKRAEVRLVRIAYENKRNGCTYGDVKVSLGDLEIAYQSREFQFHREEIEEITRRTLTNVTKNDDLSCPIELPKTQVQQFRRRAEQERNSRVARRELEDALSAEDKESLKEVSKTVPKPQPSATVRSINRATRPKPTLAELARNSAMFSEKI